jgi:hypothetical protein
MSSLASSLAAPALQSSLQGAALASQSQLVDASVAGARSVLYHADSLPGVHNLDPELTINGQTKTPVFRYNGRDASAAGWPAWGYGSTLSPIAGGVVTYGYGSCFQGLLDGSFKQPGGAGGCFAANDTTLGAIGTDDFILELVLRQPDAFNTAWYWFSKSSGSGARYDLRTNSNGTIIFVAATAAASITCTAGGPRVGQWGHVVVIGRRAGSVIIYVDRLIGTAVSMATVTATIDNPAAVIATAQNSSGANAFAGAIAYMALWTGASWLNDHRQDALVDARWQALFFGGVQP